MYIEHTLAAPLAFSCWQHSLAVASTLLRVSPIIAIASPSITLFPSFHPLFLFLARTQLSSVVPLWQVARFSLAGHFPSVAFTPAIGNFLLLVSTSSQHPSLAIMSSQ